MVIAAGKKDSNVDRKCDKFLAKLYFVCCSHLLANNLLLNRLRYSSSCVTFKFIIMS